MAVFIKRVFALLIASLVAGVTGSVMSTYRTIIDLREIGAPISDGTAFSTALYDVQHFAPLYTLFITIAFLIAFLVSGGLYKTIKFGRPIIYIVAGATAILVMLYLMKQVFFGVPIVAGARDNTGLLLQILAGGLGGLCFALLSKTKAQSKIA
ncbi:hypothetical protein [Fretibacter rubidus]|uniref:hypothetical protein n=1 Tax=Fretibacter rubidus TaxID=570162 RepID=UPI00352B9E3D